MSTTDSMSQHIDRYCPSKCLTIQQLHEHAGWSLRCETPLRKGCVLLDIPWSDILETTKARQFLSNLRNDIASERGSSSIALCDGDDEWMNVLRSSSDEVIIAAALLLSRSLTTAPKSLLSARASEFNGMFGWIHDVVKECGDLGIPLTCACDDGDVGAEQRVVSRSLGLSCFGSDGALVQRVAEDYRNIRHCFSRLVTGLGCEADRDGGNGVKELLAVPNCTMSWKDVMIYVAWVRSRWICFPAVPSDDAAATVPQGKGTRRSKDDKQKRTTSSQSKVEFAVVPLLEKLNHHPDSAMCPTVHYKASVQLIADFNTSSPNRLQAGDEIFISYGALPNSHLLERYGFLLPLGQNPADVYSLALTEPSSSEGKETARRWHISSDCLVGHWSLRLCSMDGATLDVAPADVVFRCVVEVLATCEREGVVSAPQFQSDDDDSDEDGPMTTMSIGDGERWQYDDKRMCQFMSSMPEGVIVHAIAYLRLQIDKQFELPAKRCLEMIEAANGEAMKAAMHWAVMLAQQRLAVGEAMKSRVANAQRLLSL